MLESNFGNPLQVQDDLEKGVAGAVPIPPDDSAKEEVIAAIVANVEAMIKADRKIPALKQLQVSRNKLWRKIANFWTTRTNLQLC